MTCLTILEFPDPRLRTRATPVAAVDGSLRELIDDMLETMYAAKGIGLAATQVDVHQRVLVMDLIRGVPFTSYVRPGGTAPAADAATTAVDSAETLVALSGVSGAAPADVSGDGVTMEASQLLSMLDLRVATRSVLERAGVRPEHIDDKPPCTRCDERFFSYRRDGKDGGVHMAFIAMR